MYRSVSLGVKLADRRTAPSGGGAVSKRVGFRPEAFHPQVCDIPYALGNAGLLIFVDGRKRPEYVPWTDVEQVELDRPPAMYPPLGG